MIGQDLASAQRLVTGFKALIEYEQLSPERALEFDQVAASAVHPRFPGALLVWPRQGKPPVYYAVTADSAEWRRLRPLLLAYVGPTLTSFNGRPEPLLPDQVPVERYLSGGNWYTVARLVPGIADEVQKMAQRSMHRLLAMLESMPTITHTAPEPTSRLLARFVDCLNGDDYTGAEQILAVCKSELRVDALNLLFLQVRLLAHFGRWQDIVNLPQFASLCQTRRPPYITATLLEAVYHTSAPEAQCSVEAFLTCYTPERRALARPLLQLPIPPSAGHSALRLYAAEALTVEPLDAELERAVLAHAATLGEFAHALLAKRPTGAPAEESKSSAVVHAPLSVAKSTMVEAERTNTLIAIGEALTRIEQLDDQQRVSLFRSELFKQLYNALVSESGGSAPPRNWNEWFNRLSDPAFVSAHELLQRATTEWPAAKLIDTVDISSFVTAASTVPDCPPAADRLADALPALAKWVAEDPQFPRAGMRPIYEILLYHLVLGVRRGAEVFESAALLVRALLEVGTTPQAYEVLLDDCLDLLGDGMAKRRVYWLFTVIEETILNACPAPGVRQRFWLACYQRLSQVQAYLTPGHRMVLAGLSISLGWPTLPEPVSVAEKQDDLSEQMCKALEGKSVGIYTLTETAGRQAGQALRDIVPSLRVLISNDLVGTPGLKNMAQVADLFVLVTASAKHAASGFIQQHRPKDKVLLFANGQGFTSIVRAVEEYVTG